MLARLRARLAAASPAERGLMIVGVPLAVAAGLASAWRRRKAGETDDTGEVGASATTAPASLTAPTVAPGVDPGEVASLIEQITGALGDLGDRIADLENPEAAPPPPDPTPIPGPMPWPMPSPRPAPMPPAPAPPAAPGSGGVGVPPRQPGNRGTPGTGTKTRDKIPKKPKVAPPRAIGVKVPPVAVNPRRVIGGRSGPAGARVV